MNGQSEVLEQFNEDYKDFGEEKNDKGFMKSLSEDVKQALDTPNPNVKVNNKDEVKDKANAENKDKKKNKFNLKNPLKTTGNVLKNTWGQGKRLMNAKGIALLLILILFIVIAIKPTGNGQTRLQLMFSSLLGKAKLEGVKTEPLSYMKDEEYKEAVNDYLIDEYGQDGQDVVDGLSQYKPWREVIQGVLA